MSFTALLEDLENLQKAKPLPNDEGDDKIAAAAGDEAAQKAAAQTQDAAKEEKDEKGEKEEEGEEEEEEGEEEEEEGEEEGERPFGKSFSVTLENGAVVEAYDATEILKSFDVRLSEMDLLKADIAALKAREIPTSEDVQRVLAAQTDLIKSLQSQVAALAAEGRGRKSTLNVHEKPAPAGHQRPDTPSGEELLTKAMVAQRQGRLTSLDVARLESYLGRGLTAPADIISRL